MQKPTGFNLKNLGLQQENVICLLTLNEKTGCVDLIINSSSKMNTVGLLQLKELFLSYSDYLTQLSN